MKVTIEQDGDEFLVWALLDDGWDVAPRKRGESFVIGVGTTKEDAVTSAIKELERAMEQAEALR